MPDTQAPSTSDQETFIDLVLRRALTAPGAATDPAAGRVLARLLAVIAAERGDAVLAPYLTAIPGLTSNFEVRMFRAGNLTPETVSVEAGPVAALRTALRLAREGDAGVEVISRPPSVEVERCVLVRDATGEIEFRFASPETLSGDPAACSVALQAWTSTLEDWAQITATEWGTGPVRAAAPLSELPTEPVPAAVVPRKAAPPGSDLEALTDTVRECFAGLTVEVLSRFSDNGAVIDALEGFFSNLTIEVDLRQVEQLVRQAVELDRREIVEPIAQRVAEIVGQPTGRRSGRASAEPATAGSARPRDPGSDFHPTGSARDPGSDFQPAGSSNLVRVEPPLMTPFVVPGPSVAEIAEVVSAQVGALLSETILNRRFGEGGTQASALRGMVAAVEQLDVHLDGLRDEVRRSNALLMTFDERLEANDRRAAIVERVSSSVEQEMQRLARRVDEQVTALAGSAGGGSELADGVARLTRKLRQSVAQLDRALVRLDALMDAGILVNGG